MQGFEYYTPTRVIFGKDTEERAGELVKALGGARALVHYGGGSVVRSGLLDRVLSSLDKAGVWHTELGGVVPNPRLSLVYKGIELCRKEGVDFILAVGGGSAIDSAKAIAYGVKDGGDVWDFYTKSRMPSSALPLGVVLTLAATGSEMSNSSVITNEDGWLKMGCNNDLSRPRFAIMNPVLTFTVPEHHTMSGCVDIMMHTLERWFSSEEDTELTDCLAEGLLKTVMRQAKILLEDPENYEARSEVFWAGSLSHNGLTGCGRTGDWACHQLEHELSGMFDVTHGAGLAALWGSWARYVCKSGVARFEKLAVNVLGVPPDHTSPEKTALKGIEAMEAFFRSIRMPVSISGLGVELTDGQIEELAYKCSHKEKRVIGGLQKLNKKDMEEIYRMAR